MAAGTAAVLLKTNVHSRAFPNPRSAVRPTNWCQSQTQLQKINMYCC